MNADPRVAELIELAAEEGIALPMPPDMIVCFERMGCVVDLFNGCVYSEVSVKLKASGKAVAYLLCEVVGEIVIT